jgi:hypothetical protein
MLAKVEAALVPPPRKWLRVIIDDGDDEVPEAKKKEKALAEHVAHHPEDVGRTVEDFNRSALLTARACHLNRPSPRGPATPRVTSTRKKAHGAQAATSLKN